MRERTTRSQKKQSEANMKKALAESAKRVVAKKKKKVGETSKAIQINEMDLDLQDEDEIEEKKSQEKASAVEDFVLSKRTRSATKAKKIQVLEQESEEETGNEQDKLVKFQKRTIMKVRLLLDVEEEGMVLLLEKLELQGWKDMVLQLEKRLAKAEIVEFCANCEESGAKDVEIERLKKQLVEVEGERDSLKSELAKEKEKNDGILQDMLKLFQAKS
ncbi:uncharacterized protein [Nicotiana tomentosiformis]|uniref:uncharacterized protein n=1 Tax=Nicotiana tomentosiformis TaxID=4098 RepID=UPI00388CDFDD